MPGFGQADKPRRLPYEVPSYARFLQGGMAQLGIERAHLVLHDFGGPFGLMWGLEHPESWASVVLLNVGVLPGYRWHTMARCWRTPVLGELMNAWIPRWAWRRAMQSQNPKGLPAEFVDKMHHDFDRGTRRAVLALYRATDDPAKLASELGPQIAALRKPALVVWGDKDPYASAQYAERQREFFDVEGLVIIPGSGHWPFIDDPEPVEQAVVSFLRPRLQPQAEGG